VALLEPDVRRAAPEQAEGADDRAPDWVAGGTPEPLLSDLVALLGADRVLHRASDIVRYATDASPYRRFPRAIVVARDADDVAKVIRYARGAGLPVTFRGGGTSLNGQGQSDGILVDVRRHFSGLAAEEEGRLARVAPGMVLGHANRFLAPLGRKLGPDPASTDIATVGGVIANNSGGMRCGVTADAYSTVRELTFVLPSGTAIDTGAPGAAERFAEAEPELVRGLEEIRDELRADADLRERIRRKFEIKNTTGYRLCAFLDEDEPLQIFRRLLVGSEGTLAFIAEAVFETVPLPRLTTVSWLQFPGMDEAVEAVPGLVDCGATAVELMVAPSLIVAAHNIPGTPEAWKELPPESVALLVEFGADTEEELDALVAAALEQVPDDRLINPADYTREAEQIELDWRVREGMHGLLGKLKAPGTALIIEDVCVPPSRIAECARDLQALLAEHGFLPGVAGHASAGNLHFMLTPDFSQPEDVERYEALMGGVVELILDKYDGSLKAEHGTGINMAPYVEREWGAKATELMWRVKELADPDGVLAPGVVLNRDPEVHLRDLHSNPEIEEVANSCVECGFCEPVCPSRHLTTTPRQRIVLRREMARQPEGSPVRRVLLEEYEYDAIETCAADGTCRLACPVGIDTGELVKQLRRCERGEREERVALAVARRWERVEAAARGGLRMGKAIERVAGSAPLRGASALARRAVSRELVPEWGEAMPPPAAPGMPFTTREGASAVYVPACINRIFGRPEEAEDGPSLPEALVEVSRRAGAPLWIPPGVEGSCCGVPWSSKGFAQGNAEKVTELVARLWRWSGGGELPVVIDASSCSHGIADPPEGALSGEAAERHAKLRIVDSVAWLADTVVPALELSGRVGSVTIHPTCSSRHLGHTAKLAAVAGALADDVHLPVRATCCGFAGDRGLLHPELTEAATEEEAREVRGRSFDGYLSSNRTCEIGLERAMGHPYESPVFLLELLSRRGVSAGTGV
jgi:D-lactate dehydrogenase